MQAGVFEVRVSGQAAVVGAAVVEDAVVRIENDLSRLCLRHEGQPADFFDPVPAFFLRSARSDNLHLYRHDTVAVAHDRHIGLPALSGFSLLHLAEGVVDPGRPVQPLFEQPAELAAADLFAHCPEPRFIDVFEFPAVEIGPADAVEGRVADDVPDHVVEKGRLGIDIAKIGELFGKRLRGFGDRFVMAAVHESQKRSPGGFPLALPGPVSLQPRAVF